MKSKPFMRLAFRQEGGFWNAYLAMPDTMNGAVLLGSIVLHAVHNNPDIKRAFMDCMKAVMSDGVGAATGKLVEAWEEQPAPESERSGHS